MNDQPPDVVARIEALEILAAHQERSIAELNDVITSHWRRFEAFERLIAQMRDELQNIAPQRGAREPPPPHY
jgi:SlyX protein